MLATFAKYASRTCLAAIEEVQLTLGQWVGVTVRATGRRLIHVCTYVCRRYAHIMARSLIGRHHFAFFSHQPSPSFRVANNPLFACLMSCLHDSYPLTGYGIVSSSSGSAAWTPADATSSNAVAQSWSLWCVPCLQRW